MIWIPKQIFPVLQFRGRILDLCGLAMSEGIAGFENFDRVLKSRDFVRIQWQGSRLLALCFGSAAELYRLLDV